MEILRKDIITLLPSAGKETRVVVCSRMLQRVA
jgi:hypothetical protein